MIALQKQSSAESGRKIADRLKQLRKEKGITQSELAESIGMSRVTAAGYENGTAVPSADTLIKLACAYNVSVDWLCGLNESPVGSRLVTFADVAYVLTELIDMLDVRIGAAAYQTPDGENVRVELSFDNYTLGKFLIDYNKIRSLSIDGVMERELVKLWIDNKLGELGELRVRSEE